MASTPNHAVQGALLHAVPCVAFNAGDAVTAAAATLGAVCGAMPDILGWAGRQLGLLEEWALYGSAHHGPINRMLRWIPAYGLHTELVDPTFHKPDGAWWPRDWWKELALWVLNAITLYLVCK